MAGFKRKREPTFQGHAWTFTLNNYTDEHEKAVMALKEFSSYLVVGKEIAPTTGTPHYQGYVYMLQKQSHTAMKRGLKGAWIVPSKATDYANFTYATEDGNLLVLHGTPPCQGQRSDLDDVRDMTTMREVVAAGAGFQAYRMQQIRLTYLEPRRMKKPFCVWIYGPSGVGKSHDLKELYPDAFIPKNYKWWDGYDAHKVVIIDDVRGDFCKFNEFLQLVDHMPYQVECKGGMRQLRAEMMFFTSCKHPIDLYKDRTEEDLYQLTRRFDWIVSVERVTRGVVKHVIMRAPRMNVCAEDNWIA